MTLKGDKEGVIPLSKEAEEQLSIWFNNINLKIDLAKEIEKKDKEISRLNNIINELEKYLKSHTRKVIEELQFENINKNTFYAFKKIALLDRNKIYDILQKRK